jgi:hypothetical protein
MAYQLKGPCRMRFAPPARRAVVPVSPIPGTLRYLPLLGASQVALSDLYEPLTTERGIVTR